MPAAVCFGTNDLSRAGAFYDNVLTTVGMIRLDANANEIGYGAKGGEAVFWVIVPFNRKKASYGNGSQIIIKGKSSEQVDRFYQTALDHGGSDEGAPGLRDHTPGYYGAYCRDPDGNKLHAFAMVA